MVGKPLISNLFFNFGINSLAKINGLKVYEFLNRLKFDCISSGLNISARIISFFFLFNSFIKK